jgi:hypothetical protein
MDRPLSRRLKIVGWGNLVLGLCTPPRVCWHLVAALNVFSYAWCKTSIWFLLAVGSIIGTLSGWSGWGILKRRAWAQHLTCAAGGATLGYAGAGIMFMVAYGIHRGLDILIRHGSSNWWDWSLTHFQSPVFVELPLVTWWIFCLRMTLGTPGLESRPDPASGPGAGIVEVIGCAILGGITRVFQISVDMVHYSNR